MKKPHMIKNSPTNQKSADQISAHCDILIHSMIHLMHKKVHNYKLIGLLIIEQLMRNLYLISVLFDVSIQNRDV